MRNKTLKSTVLPQAEAKGTKWNMFVFLGLRLRQHGQFLKLAIVLFLWKEIDKNKVYSHQSWLTSFLEVFILKTFFR